LSFQWFNRPIDILSPERFVEGKQTPFVFVRAAVKEDIMSPFLSISHGILVGFNDPFRLLITHFDALDSLQVSLPQKRPSRRAAEGP